MTIETVNKIVGLVYDIKHFDRSLRSIRNWDDEVGEFMRYQDRYAINDLLKELTGWLNRDADPRDKTAILAYLHEFLAREDGQPAPPAPFPYLEIELSERLVAA